MGCEQLVLGSINQGAPRTMERGLWRPGDILSAYERHIAFFGIDRGANFLDIHVAQALRQLGSIACRVSGRMRPTDTDCEIAIMTSENDTLRSLAEMFTDVELHDLVMTLPHGSAVQPGDLYQFGYLSVFEACGSGIYRLVHDYPLQRISGPRFEVLHDA